MSESDKPTGEPEPVDAEFETIEDEANRPEKPSSGPGWLMFASWMLATALFASGITWGLTTLFGSGSGTDTSALESRIAALESEDQGDLALRVDALEAETRRIADTQDTALGEVRRRLNALDQTVEAVEARPAQAETTEPDDGSPVSTDEPSVVATDFEERVLGLEQAVTDLRDAVQALANRPAEPVDNTAQTDVPSDAVTDPASEQVITDIQTMIADLQSRLDSQRDTLMAEDESLADRLDTLQAALSDVRADLESGLSEVQIASADSGQSTDELRQLSSRALALTALRDAASGSGPFEAERAALYRTWRDQSALRELQPISRAGVETRRELLSSFPFRAVRDAAGQTRTVFGFIQVRPSDGRDEADGPLAIASQIETRLGNDNLRGAVEAARNLEGEPASQAATWLSEAENRLLIERVLDQLRLDLAIEAETRGVEP